jgi:SPP1 family predicted phage head-tail adaptor
MIAAGTLNRRITFITGTLVADGQGGNYDTGYANIGSVPNVWASLEPLRGAELVSAQQVKPDARWRIVTRWRTDLLTTYALTVLEGATTLYFAVVSILPKRMEGTIMIDARQVTAGDLGL